MPLRTDRQEAKLRISLVLTKSQQVLLVSFNPALLLRYLSNKLELLSRLRSFVTSETILCSYEKTLAA